MELGELSEPLLNANRRTQNGGGLGTRLAVPSLRTRPSKNRKGGSGKSAGVEVYTAPGMQAHFRLAFFFFSLFFFRETDQYHKDERCSLYESQFSKQSKQFLSTATQMHRLISYLCTAHYKSNTKLF